MGSRHVLRANETGRHRASRSIGRRLLARAQAAPFESRDLLLGLATDTFVPGIVRATAIAGMQLSGDAVSAAVVGERSREFRPNDSLGSSPGIGNS